MFNDTRSFIDKLGSTGDLVRVTEKVDWDLEIGAISRLACEIAAFNINGVSMTSMGSSGSFLITTMNPAATQELVMDTAAVSAEQALGGVKVNQVPRDGGNTFNGTFFGAFANSAMQGNNLHLPSR